MRKESLVQDFKKFLIHYRSSWNNCDVNEMTNHNSKQLQSRWANNETIISDSDFDGSQAGWTQVFSMYKDRNPRWHFEDVSVEIKANNEAVVVFWCTFELDGKLLNEKILFVETFRKEDQHWKKIREYAESGFQLVSVSAL